MGAPKRKWTSEQEEALEAGIKKHGVGKWKIILEDPEFSRSFGGRSNKDLRTHYNWYSQRKEILKKKQRTGATGKWTEEEVKALIAGVNKHGAGKWKDIQNDPEYSHCLGGRSIKGLQNSYDYHSRRKYTLKKMRKGWEKGIPYKKWTSEEKEALIAAVDKHGTGKWKDIEDDPEYSHSLAGRSNIDLRAKWTSMILPKVPKTPADTGAITEVLNQGAWTSTEDRILCDYIKAHGEGGWSTLPTKAGLKRRGDSCRQRWFKCLGPGSKRRMVTGKSFETGAESQIAENHDKIRGSTDHCKENDSQCGNGFLECPLGGRNFFQNYEIDCSNSEICCFSDFSQLCSFSGERTDDYLSLCSGDSSLFLDEIPQNWTGSDFLSDITGVGLEEDWLKE